MSTTNSVVICNGTNPPRKKKGDRLSKTLNPLAPEFVPKFQEPTPPSSGKSTFADPVYTPVKQDYPPYLGPYPYPGWPQVPCQVGYAPYPAPAAAAAYGYESHTSFGRNITREVMAVLNNPSPPRPSTDGSREPAYPPTNAVSQTS